jgi:hypothetical protein
VGRAALPVILLSPGTEARAAMEAEPPDMSSQAEPGKEIWPWWLESLSEGFGASMVPFSRHIEIATGSALAMTTSTMSLRGA